MGVCFGHSIEFEGHPTQYTRRQLTPCLKGSDKNK